MVVALSTMSGRSTGDRSSSECDAAERAGLDYSRKGHGQLAWADEFDGDAVDTRRWTIRDHTTLSFDQAIIRSRNVSVRDGTW